MNRSLNIFVVLSMLLAVSTGRVAATNPIFQEELKIPSFPACPNPGGEVIADYASGVHGVPGDSTTYTGKDIVYKLNDTQVVQCLCADPGEGIQTLWWKVPELSKEDKKNLIAQGWIRVPNGALWGLDEAEYYAKNSSYSCTTGGDGGHVDGSSSSNGGSSSSSSSSSSNSSGSILGASTLAATGNWSSIAGLFCLAAGLILAGHNTRKYIR